LRFIVRCYGFSMRDDFKRMNPVYFETRFRTDRLVIDWPSEFVILSAFATTGQSGVGRVGACFSQARGTRQRAAAALPQMHEYGHLPLNRFGGPMAAIP
jgi:hypothetical protein